jgi:hypothetical protein
MPCDKSTSQKDVATFESVPRRFRPGSSLPKLQRRCNGLRSSRINPRAPYRGLDERARARHNYFNALRRLRNRSDSQLDLTVQGCALSLTGRAVTGPPLESLAIRPATCARAGRTPGLAEASRLAVSASQIPDGPNAFESLVLTAERLYDGVRVQEVDTFVQHPLIDLAVPFSVFVRRLRRQNKAELLSRDFVAANSAVFDHLRVPPRFRAFAHLLSVSELSRRRFDLALLRRRQGFARRRPSDVVSCVPPQFLDRSFLMHAARHYAESLFHPKWSILSNVSRLKLLEHRPAGVVPVYTRLTGLVTRA